MTVLLTEADTEGLYGSKMLSGTELGDRKIRSKIADVVKQTLQGRNPGEPARTKLVLVLAGQEKMLALNATNYNYLVERLGRDPRRWEGVEIGIKAEATTFGGRPVRGLRVEVLPAAAPLNDATPF